MSIVKNKFQYGGRTVTLETGRVARKATGSVLISVDNTVVLCTVVATDTDTTHSQVSVHYQEKTYAAGKIPGGFLKREGRPTEKEILTSRLIDRPIRPLFPKWFINEVQIICTVMSAERNQDPDLAAMLGTSAALCVSGVPFSGPIGAARVALTQARGYLINPSLDELAESSLNMVVAGTSEAVLMVESSAAELPEDEMLGAVLFAHREMQVAVDAIKQFSDEAGKKDNRRWKWSNNGENINSAFKFAYDDGISQAYRITEKSQRQDALASLKVQAMKLLAKNKNSVKDAFASLSRSIVRRSVINGSPRIDGRDFNTVRPLSIEVGVLPRAHGSALFTRGETQAIVATTLGTMREAQLIEGLSGERHDRLIFHYNFPPYSVGEAGLIGWPKRREIGHGNIAKRGVAAMVPKGDDFPYSIRVVSEITESNGSSSMASVCGASLALMDAGVPLKAPVAGIAMGMIKEGDDYAVLTDILGDEDHFGDMDLKVAGSANGVTVLQMDLKISGINAAIMEVVLGQAFEARQSILAQMNKVIGESRKEVADHAPMMATLQIDTEKIRDVIGKGGAMIRQICSDTGAEIYIQDDGIVRIYADTKEGSQKAIDTVLSITATAEAEINKLYRGKVVRVAEFGAFVNVMPGTDTDGMVHISQIVNSHVNDVRYFLNVGDMVTVKVLDVDNRGRVKLSIKEITPSEKADVDV